MLLVLLLLILTWPAATPKEQGGGGDTAPAAAAVQLVGEGSRGRSSADSTPPPVFVAIVAPQTTEAVTAPAVAPVGAPSAGGGSRAGGGGSGGGTGTGIGPGVGSGSGPGTGNGTPAPATPAPTPPPPPPPLRTAPPFFNPPRLSLPPVKPGFTRVIFYVADDETSAWIQGVCVGYDAPDCGAAGSRTDGYGRYWADLYPDSTHPYWNFQFLLPGFQPTVIRVDQHGGTTTIIPVRLAHAR